MYNEERKLSYISQELPSTAQKEYARSIFERSASTEELAGRDLCELYSSSIRQVLSDVCGTLHTSAVVIFSMIRRYIKWCKQQGYPTTDAIDECEPDLVSKVKSSMIVFPSHLLRTLDYVFPASEVTQVQKIFRAYFWLAFSGFTDEEAIRVTADQLDFRQMCIRFEDHNPSDHPIYPLAIDDLRAAAELQQFTEPHATSPTLVIKYRLPGNSILRGRIPKGEAVSDDPLRTFLRPSVSRAFQKARQRYEKDEHLYRNRKHKPSLHMTYSTAYLSGIFYRAWLREQKNRYYILPKRREPDYKNWKLAFHEELETETTT